MAKLLQLFLKLPAPVMFLAISAAGGYVLCLLASVSFWVSWAIAAAALFVNGIIADIEDRSPGGFDNPDPS